MISILCLFLPENVQQENVKNFNKEEIAQALRCSPMSYVQRDWTLRVAPKHKHVGAYPRGK